MGSSGSLLWQCFMSWEVSCLALLMGLDVGAGKHLHVTRRQFHVLVVGNQNDHLASFYEDQS